MSSRRPALGYAILGLLKGKPMSGYAVRMIFETTALGSYSSSPGSIYPALKRLEQEGWIRAEAGGFAVTAAGAAALRAWVTAPPTAEELARHGELIDLRLAFMDGVATKAEILAFLDELAQLLDAQLAELERQARTLSLPLCAGLAFQGGLEACRHKLDWARRARGTVATGSLAESRPTPATQSLGT